MTLSKKEYLEYVKGDIDAKKKVEIDRFLNDNPLERKSLEAAIAHNQVHTFEDLVDLLEEQIDQQVNIPVTQSKESDNVKSQRGIFPFLPYITSSAAAVLIVFFILSHLKSTSVNVEAYFDTYPELITSTVRGENQSINADLHQALLAYNQDDHANAARLLESAIDVDPIDKRLSFYHAVSLVGAGDYKKALPLLKGLATDAAFPYMDGVIWNMALCQLGLGQKESARFTLELVASDNVYKKKEAEELLSQL